MEGLDLIARGPYEDLKVRLSEDSHSMPVRDKLLRFAVLRALLVACESPDILNDGVEAEIQDKPSSKKTLALETKPPVATSRS